MNKIFSLIIIGIFSTIIIGGSGWTLKSVTEKETNWAFLNRIYGSKPVVASTPTEKTVSSESKNIDKDCQITTDQKEEKVSIVNYLKSLGQPSGYKDRAKLAQDYQISNYTGSAHQNLNLLKNLKTKINNCE
jgi:hypothetical protein